MPKFLTKPVGNTVNEMLDFCNAALAWLEELDKKEEYNPFI